MSDIKGLQRRLKNTVKQYTEAEALVREATSNDPWGPSSSIMRQISDMTFNAMSYHEIMSMIWRRLNDKFQQKNWRHVYKSLILLDYLIRSGNSRVVEDCRNNIHAISTLREFQYYEEHRDLGQNVREKSKAILAVLNDEELLEAERKRYQNTKDRLSTQQSTTAFYGNSSSVKRMSSRMNSGGGDVYTFRRGMRAADSTPDLSQVGLRQSAIRGPEPQRPVSRPAEDEDADIQLALQLSRQEHEKEQQNKALEQAKIKIALQESLKSQSLQPSSNSSGAGLVALRAPPAHQPRQNMQGADPWGNKPAQSTRGAHFDPWASGGRTYLGFADQLPAGQSNGSIQTITGGSHSSSAVPASSDNLLGIDLTGGSSQLVPHSFQPKTVDLLGPLDDAFSLPQDDPFQPSGSLFSAANTAPVLRGPVAGFSKSTVDLSLLDDSLDLEVQAHGLNGDPRPPSQPAEVDTNPTGTNQRRNSMHDFLSQNKSLVDLDNIVVPRPATVNQSSVVWGGGSGGGGVVNPFQITHNLAAMTAVTTAFPTSSSTAASTVNPFFARQQEAGKPSLSSLQAAAGGSASPTVNWGLAANTGYANNSNTHNSLNPFI